MLRVTELTFAYHEAPLLNDIHFHLAQGGLMHLKGKNGAGKTTLLKLIAGLYPPSRGQILFFEQSIHQNLSQYQSQMCYVGHKPGISSLLSIKENCLFDMHYGSKPVDVNALIPIFGLEPHVDKLCGRLSAGQRRQVALLRLWMTKAVLWLLDEPFVALDDFATQVLVSKIKEHLRCGGSVILTTHQALSLEAFDYQEYVL